MTNIMRFGNSGCVRLWACCCFSLFIWGQLSDAQTIQGYTFNNNVNDILGLGSVLDTLYFQPDDSYDDGTALINNNFGPLDLDAQGNPLFQLNLEYWNDNSNYAKDLVEMVYSASDMFQSIQSKPAAREAGALEALRVMVMRSAVLREMHQAVTQCPSDARLARKHWDQAAAFYFGKSSGFTKESYGRTLYDLSWNLCQRSRTCRTTEIYDDSLNNQDIVSKLNQGQAQISTGSCNELSSTEMDISRLLLVPSIQYLIKHSYELATFVYSRDTSGETTSHVHLLSLMPYLTDCDGSKANFLLHNFKVQESTYMSSGYEQVSQTLKEFLPCLGLRCAQIGVYHGSNPYSSAEIKACTDAPGATPRPTHTPTRFPSRQPTTPSPTTKTPTPPLNDVESQSPTQSPTLRSNDDGGLKASANNSQTSMVVGLSTSVALTGLLIGFAFVVLQVRQKRRAAEIPVTGKNVIVAKTVIVAKNDPLDMM